tara:strand:- start:5556 stop:6263 length:708 start_codon:yes stop_codon:yes gene_type:complete
MTTFSNKILYTKGNLDYRCLTLVGDSIEQTFNFKDPLFNVISIEAAQGEINTNNSSEWISVSCKEIDKKIENGITDYDTSLVLTKSTLPFVKTHTSRYFSKPKDRLDALSISMETTTGTKPTLTGSWIIELEIITVRVPTHADWRNIPDTESGKDANEMLLESEPNTTVSASKEKEKKEHKKNIDTSKKKPKKKENLKNKVVPVSSGSSLQSMLLASSLGLIGVGSAVAMGVNFK